MDRGILFESLVVWLETFKLDAPHGTADQLSDGIAMAQVLHQIAPDYFNDSWLSKIKMEEVTNWRLKVSNLKKILKGILEYNIEVLGIQIHDFQMPDVNAVGEHSDQGELGRLLQLILGCAVNCSEKQEYIQRIMSMEESVQHAVMTAIQELMTKEITSDGDSEVGEQLKRTAEDLNSAIEAKEELMQRCHELDLQVTTLVEEKQNLAMENEKLSERLNQAENLDDPSTPAGKRFQQLQHQLDQCQEENYKLESGKDDFRIKVDVLQKEVSDLQDRNTELSSMADECRQLKDELDDVRHTAEQVVKYEAQIDSYKKRMDELSDLRGQVKLLEEKNTKYMQENIELQEEVRKSGALKQQLEVYKRQVLELQNKVTEETKRADKSEFEVKRIQDRVSTFQREKERLVTERDSLREVNEELKCTQLQHVGAAGDGLSAASQAEMLSLPPEIKEKLLRLEHENKMLKLKETGDNDEQSQVLQNMLDDANLRKNELETELRLANQKSMELEAQIEDLQEMAKSSVSSSELVELRKKLDEQVQITQQKDKIIQKERESVTDLQSQVTTRTEEVERLRDDVDKKEEEKRVMGDKYKKYFDKARAVITSQEQKLKSTGNYYPDVQALKQQLQEKDKFIEQLQKEQDKNKTTFEQEEKMMVSAWYNLGIQLHRQAAIDRLENSQGQAFLARQRQVHLRGQQRIPNSHTNTSSDLENSNLGDLDLNTANTGDGCFASLFDCLLMKLRAEIQLQSDLDPLVARDSVNVATVRNHLLAGLLGQMPDHTDDLMTGDERQDYLEPSGQSNLSHDSISDEHFEEFGKDHLLTPSKYMSEFVPETPEHRQKPTLKNASLLRLRCKSPQRASRAEEQVTFKETVDHTGVDEPTDIVEHVHDCEKTSNNLAHVSDLEKTPGCYAPINDSVFAELDLYEMKHLNDRMGDDDLYDNLDRESTTDFKSYKLLEKKQTFDTLDEVEEQQNCLLPLTHKVCIDNASQGPAECVEHPFSSVGSQETVKRPVSVADLHNKHPLKEHTPVTPLRNKNTDNIPVHLQSPFIKKIPTDHVTKRRARRKRKRDIHDEGKENIDDTDDFPSVTSIGSDLSLCLVDCDSHILDTDYM